MSYDTNTTTLGDFGGSTPEDDQTAPDQGHTQPPKWNPDGQSRCQCGAAVGAEVARVFGDNSNTVPACATCHEARDGRGAYVSDSAALVSYLGGDL